ncbi:DUF3304 domain-containing protein [Iodobacter arcticus]|uniref:DUF3304 domain-containing protein n=1 Tax=Iodobacter arcticus TaxID=590593 RepID=A0ABW2R232_9NEIS
MKLIKVKAHFGYWVILLALSACRPAESEAVGKRVDANSVTVSVDAVNYQHDLDVQYTLKDASNNAVGGAIVGLLEGPGAKNCCTLLPKKWRPGLKYHLSWEEGSAKEISPIRQERTLELPRYSAPGDLYVLFYPNHEVELIASPVEPGHANWAGREKAGALTACVARLSEKECRKHLPKYRLGSKEQIAAEFRASCQSNKIRTASDPENTSNWTAQDCVEMRDYCLKEMKINKAMCEINYQEE